MLILFIDYHTTMNNNILNKVCIYNIYRLVYLYSLCTNVLLLPDLFVIGTVVESGGGGGWSDICWLNWLCSWSQEGSIGNGEPAGDNKGEFKGELEDTELPLNIVCVFIPKEIKEGERPSFMMKLRKVQKN